MGRAKMGELKRAALRLGVTTTTLRQHGWKTVSPDRIRAVMDNPPGWLTEARDRRHKKRDQQRRRSAAKSTAERLGIRVRAVQERGIQPGDVGRLLAAPPAWLVTEQKRRRAQAGREAQDKLRRELTDALVTSIHDVWFQELKRAATGAEAAAIDARWAPEVDRAKREARQMVEVLTPEQVRARIDREQNAAYEAGVYRASQIVRRALEPGDGRGQV